ncbi:MAG: metallophosphoesterase [Christensenellales bacterium]|jgi:UDP-2,3-diacylglucosamine pyrophosphatase LpxH
MYGIKRINRIYESAKRVSFDNNSKIVLMSDCHRGDGSWADTFSKNQNSYLAALNYYYKQEFIYIELGDGDELWENNEISEIINAHKDIFYILSQFHKQKRLYFIYGNHDMAKKNRIYVKENMFRYFDTRFKQYFPLFEDTQIYEGLVLSYVARKNGIFLIHGHQVDFFNCAMWRLSKFLVKFLWRPLEIFGVNDPTSTAKNYDKKKLVEEKLSSWVADKNLILIAGHTHRPVFPDLGMPRYFNAGSCVHPRCITAIEISCKEIMLVKWCVKTKDDGTLYIGREILAGPVRLSGYFSTADE